MGDNCQCCNHLRLTKKACLAGSQPPFLGLSAISVIPLLSQGDRGVITGTVTDVSGAVVPGTLITAIQKATNTSFKTTTSTTGDFTVPSLPVGEYQVRAEKSGFKTQITENVLIVAGGTVRVDTA